MKNLSFRFLWFLVCCSLLITLSASAGIEYSERDVVQNGTNYVEQTWKCYPTHPLSGNSGDIHTTQTFSQHPRGEEGLDLKIYSDNVAIRSSLSGKVISVVNSNEGYGNHVIIETQLGISKLQILYAHMSNNSITVDMGQEVSEGQQIGIMGSTGKSTGPHLHFEVRYDGKRIDPEILLNNQLAVEILVPRF